jgi:predicted NBD/HSP70 family sugar kinase
MLNTAGLTNFAHAGGARGSNQTTLRAYNERLVLSLVRRFGGLAKADIARSTGLSAQTVSVIMRSLEEGGLLLRGTPMKGKVGQPSVPMSLNPRGAFSIGLKVGRRTADIILIDFLGNILLFDHRAFDFSLPNGILEFVISATQKISAFLTPDEMARVAGIGIAAPFEMWNWAYEVGAPQAELDAWRDFDLTAEIAKLVPYPVFLQNDATSACGAELVFGAGPKYSDFLYVYIGSFVGGGVVINSSLFAGKSGNAGALGSMLVPGPDGKPQQLISSASVIVLEKLLKGQGIDSRPLWNAYMEWVDFGQPLEDWIQSSGRSLAHAIVSSSAVIDFEAVIIDGNFPTWVRKRMVDATNVAMAEVNTRGIKTPTIIEGRVGSQARAIGGASLPLFSRYLLDLNMLFKETP